MTAVIDAANEKQAHANPVGIGTMIDALGSDSGPVRQQARHDLVELGSLAVGPLIEAIGDPNIHRRWEATKALSAIGDARAASCLVQTLEDEDPGVRWAAGNGLIDLGEDCLEPLLRALIDRGGSVWLREGAHHVLHALVREGMEELSPLVDALEDIAPTVEVPVVAYQVLDAMSRPASAPPANLDVENYQDRHRPG